LYLRRHGIKSHTSRIKDDRQVTPPGSAYTQFYKERWASGDLGNIKAVDAAKLLGAEWKALPEAEKKVRNSPQPLRSSWESLTDQIF
jgi:hypothetical protein